MKLTYLASTSIPSRRADSVQVMAMCAAFAANGHAVTLLAGRGGGRASSDAARYGTEQEFRIIKLSRPDLRWVKSLVYWVAVHAALRRLERPDLYYGRDPLALLSASRLGPPVVYEAHARPGASRRLVESRLFSRPAFRRLVVISEALRREYRLLFPRLPESRILVAHDGANPAVPAGPDRSPGQPPAVVEGRLQVGYVGQLYRGHGIDLLVELAARLPGFDFHVIGGEERDLAYWRSRGAGPNLRFHGFLPPAECESYRQAMDVLVAPYHSRVIAGGGRLEIGRWMSPLKVFEYMASGRAIVAADLPVLREVLKPGINCLLAEPGDVDAWERALLRLEDAALRRRLGREAQRDLTLRYSWTKRAGLVLAGLED